MSNLYLFNFSKSKHNTNINNDNADNITESKNIIIEPYDLLPEFKVISNKINSNIHIKHNSCVLSMATTPKRFVNLLKTLHYFEEIEDIYKIVINLCYYYKRFKTETKLYELDFTVLDDLNKKYSEPKYVINMTHDYGPITKLIGGYQYMKKNNIENKNLIILDDDTQYLNKHIQPLINIDKQLKTKENKYLLGNSGFNYDIKEKFKKKYIEMIYPNFNNNCLLKEIMIIEGFAGIYFNSKTFKYIEQIIDFSKYYKTINWENNNFDTIVNIFLKACFLGDDLVISLMFRFNEFILYKTNRNKPKQYNYGFQNDALHKNNHITNVDDIHTTSNLKSYLIILEKIDILHNIINKSRICNSIKEVNKIIPNENILINNYSNNYFKQNVKISFSLLVRNNEKWLIDIFSNFNEIEDFYKNIDFEYHFYENNSIDNTKTLIDEFMINRKGSFHKEDLNVKCSFKPISRERGLWMNFIRRKHKQLHGQLDSDYVILVDSDVYFEKEIIKNLLETYNENNNISCLSTYCVCCHTKNNSECKHYYDSLALVTYDNIDYKKTGNTCLFSQCKRCINERKYKSNLQLLNNNLIEKKGLIEVKSAFGSLCMIPTKYYNLCNYDDNLFLKYDNVCEHYHFNIQLQKYGKIMINTDIEIFNKSNS